MVIFIARVTTAGNNAPAMAGRLNSSIQARTRNRHKRVPAAVVWIRNQIINSSQLNSTLQVRVMLVHWRKAPRQGNVVPSGPVVLVHPGVEVVEVAHVAAVVVVDSSIIDVIHHGISDVAGRF